MDRYSCCRKMLVQAVWSRNQRFLFFVLFGIVVGIVCESQGPVRSLSTPRWQPCVRGQVTLYKSSQVKACRPEGSPFRAQASEMQDFTRSTSVQREKHKILFEPHPMTILKSLHNPVVKAFPNTISFQRCFPSVGRSSACPSSSDVPMQNPASPTFRRQGCNIRSELPYCLDACDRPRFQSNVVRQHLYFIVPPMQNLVPG